MSWVWIVAGVVVVLWLLLELKTSRPDGTHLKVPPYRRMMFMIMPSRNGGITYYEAKVDCTRLLEYTAASEEEIGAKISHILVGAAFVGFASTPKMNRFVSGRRLYQRDGIWLSFSMKRGEGGDTFSRKARLATVKLRVEPGETFPQLCERINADISLNRSGKKTRADKEFQLFDALPRPVLEPAARLLSWLDYFNILPGFFIKDDPLYTSMYMANLGSIRMGPVYHHLFEYGTCPVFMCTGEIKEEAVSEGGEIVSRPIMRVRFSFDERIADGVNTRFGMEAICRVIADPQTWLGGVGEDAAQVKPMWPRDDWNDEAGRYRIDRL
ncbi:MAG: hypothetical protein ACI8S6_001089 [Myxococcota bacterium]|jgi:hypothetical protein